MVFVKLQGVFGRKQEEGKEGFHWHFYKSNGFTLRIWPFFKRFSRRLCQSKTALALGEKCWQFFGRNIWRLTMMNKFPPSRKQHNKEEGKRDHTFLLQVVVSITNKKRLLSWTVKFKQKNK